MQPTAFRFKNTYLLLFIASLWMAGCAHKDRLHEYDIYQATLAVEAPLAPLPDIVLAEGWSAEDPLNSPLENLILAAPRIINETRVYTAQKRLDRAGEEVDVAYLVAEGILDRSETSLRMIPVNHPADADFRLVVDIQRHGIHTAHGLTFFLNAHTTLFRQETGARVWTRKIEITKKVSDQGLFRNLKATRELNEMSKEEFIQMLEMISDYSADAIVDILCQAIEAY